MNKNDDILSKINHHDGLTVPDAYFNSFINDMQAALPHRDEAENPAAVILPSPSVWSNIRPYVYLAAMFAGIWCMLKMFTLISSPADSNSIFDSNPILAEAVGNDSFLYDYVIDDINQWDLYDEMIEDGFEATALDINADYDNEHNDIDSSTVQDIL